MTTLVGMAEVDRSVIPELDDFGLLHHGHAWVALSPTQERLMRRFLRHGDRPVPRAELLEEVGETHPAPSRLVDAHIMRLRRRIRPLGLTIHTIRGRGFLLVPDEPSNEARTPPWHIS